MYSKKDNRHGGPFSKRADSRQTGDGPFWETELFQKDCCYMNVEDCVEYYN